MKSIRLPDDLFHKLLHFSEMFGLIVIAIATSYAMAREAYLMAVLGKVTLTDLLLMFLFLEILVMVNQYVKAGQLPVRFPLYIAIVSLARELILNIERITEFHMLASATAVLLLAFGVLVIRYGQFKFPSNEASEHDEESNIG